MKTFTFHKYRPNRQEEELFKLLRRHWKIIPKKKGLFYETEI